jgi:hypothetical protein
VGAGTARTQDAENEHEHRSLAELEAGLDEVRRAPVGAGTLELIVRRPAVGEREVLDVAELDLVAGLVGDTWSTRASSRTSDGSAHPDMQLTLMNVRAVTLIAGDRSRWPLAGDQLYVDLAIGPEALPIGTHLVIGTAMVAVTDQPHTGCAKFAARFGRNALQLVNTPAGRALNLRGINTRVVRAGTVRVGDAVYESR